MPPANSWLAACFIFTGGCLRLMGRGRLAASRFEIQGFQHSKSTSHGLLLFCSMGLGYNRFLTLDSIISRWRYAPKSWLQSDNNQEKKKIAEVEELQPTVCLLAKSSTTVVELYGKEHVTYNMPGLVWCTSDKNEKQTLRESNAPAASDDSGSLQEQVKQVGIMLKMFAHTGQSGADVLESLGDVVRSMDNKMDSLLHHFELSLPGDLLLPLDTQEDLALLDNSMRQDKELHVQFGPKDNRVANALEYLL
ncbi:hypothetical protein F2P79_006249 [Pimephales promelas]|nr:hypothetical protein F2P79_006249 [Pimephales promelas]